VRSERKSGRIEPFLNASAMLVHGGFFQFQTRDFLNLCFSGLVLEEGVEPTRPCGHRILSPARLPVPPLQLW
jgi:hypothetical protein